MKPGDPDTLRFYDLEARAYAATASRIDESVLQRFVDALPSGGRVLEIGCGGGHDAAWMMVKGFRVTPTDASPVMAQEAEQRLGVAVPVMCAEGLEEIAAFEGVWASASLLHVPKSALPDVFRRIYRALVADGVLYCSFKTGETEGRDRLGRYYNYPSQLWLQEIMEAAGAWRRLDFETSTGAGYEGTSADWVSVFAIRG